MKWTRDPVAWFGVFGLLLAALPGSFLMGENGDPDQRQRLETGVVIWRVAWVLLGIFLLATRKFVPRGSGVCAAHGGVSKALSAVLILAFVVRLPGLGAGPWFDEIWMLVDFVRQPFGDLLRFYPTDNHHPLYTILTWGSVGILGESAWVLRLPALLFGLASLVLTFLLARRCVDVREALLATLLLAVSSSHIWFSQNGRGYTGLLFLTLLSSHAFLLSLDRNSRRDAILHGVALALASFVHVTGALVGLAHLVILLVKRTRVAGPWWGLGLGATLSVALHGLILPQMVHFFLFREGAAAVSSDWTNPTWTLLEAARSLGLGVPVGLGILAAAGVVLIAGVVGWWNRCRELVFLAFVPAVTGAAILMLLERNLWPRFFFFLAGFGVLFLVRGLMVCAHRVVGARRAVRVVEVLVVILSLSSLWTCRRVWSLPKQDFAGALEYVDSNVGASNASTTVATTGLTTFPFSSYHGRKDFKEISTPRHLEELLEKSSRVLVLYTFPTHLRSRHPGVWEILETRGREVARFSGSVGGGDVVVLEVNR